MTQSLETIAAVRGVTRLFHFTRVEYLRAILQDEALLSRKLLQERRKGWVYNDPDRLDGLIEFISTSIQFPNAQLLSSFKVKATDRPWVLIELDAGVLLNSDTRFCACNAAVGRGKHVRAGATAFDRVFEGGPESRNTVEPRLACSPADLQSEVLVKDQIAISHFQRLIVEDGNTLERVSGIINDCGFAMPVERGPAYFNAARVRLAAQGKGPLRILPNSKPTA